MHVGDAAANVIKNRELLIETLNLPSEPVWLEQTHSRNVLHYQEAVTSPRADAMYTNKHGVVCVVLTADCVPVLLCDSTGSEIAAVHAGWRGIRDGIIASTLKCFSSSPGELLAWIGPYISRRYYEVGDDVRQELLHLGAVKDHETFTRSSNNKWLADLGSLVTSQLQNAGLNGIYHSNQCTYNEADRYFSYRRHKKTGRMASLIWIDH